MKTVLLVTHVPVGHVPLLYGPQRRLPPAYTFTAVFALTIMVVVPKPVPSLMMGFGLADRVALGVCTLATAVAKVLPVAGSTMVKLMPFVTQFPVVQVPLVPPLHKSVPFT